MLMLSNQALTTIHNVYSEKVPFYDSFRCSPSLDPRLLPAIQCRWLFIQRATLKSWAEPGDKADVCLLQLTVKCYSEC